MSLPINLNHPATATATATIFHPYSPKVYVGCQNVAVQTEEFRCGELYEAEVIRDDDSYLKVFRNLTNEHDDYNDEKYWLDLNDCQVELDCDFESFMRNRHVYFPTSVVWRIVNIDIDYNNVYKNKISGLWASVVGLQTDTVQVHMDLLLSELFADGPIEWDMWPPSMPSPPSSPSSPPQVCSALLLRV